MDKADGFLSTIDIFSMLNGEERERVRECLIPKKVPAGQVLFSEGDEGRELYIVESGTIVTKVRLPDGSEREITRFSAGDFFGEMSIFENAPRSATCYIEKDTTMYLLDKNEFSGLVEKHPEIAAKIMFRMLNITTRRLRDTSEFHSDMVRWGEDARKRAITDELTGAYNRRFLDDAFVDYFDEARKSGRALSLVMVDLDFFRDINESYGHDMGDRVILAVVRVFRKHLREKDILARYGGDEFTLVMPDTDDRAAFEVADGIRKDVENLDILSSLDGPVRRVTTSQGIATYPSDARDLQGLREMADQALYRAKDDGRNRVFCARLLF